MTDFVNDIQSHNKMLTDNLNKLVMKQLQDKIETLNQEKEVESLKQ